MTVIEAIAARRAELRQQEADWRVLAERHRVAFDECWADLQSRCPHPADMRSKSQTGSGEVDSCLVCGAENP